MNRYWVYHPNQDAKIVESDEYYKLLGEGWYNTPADFPNNKNVALEIADNSQGLGNYSINKENEKRRGRPPKNVT
jgi:hypothetical protein